MADATTAAANAASAMQSATQQATQTYSALDRVYQSATMVVDGMSKVGEISWNAIIGQAGTLVDKMKEIGKAAYDVSQKTEVTAATLKQLYKDQAPAVYQKMNDMADHSLLQQDDILKGINTLKSVGINDDKAIDAVGNLASARGKSMADVAAAFAKMKSGDVKGGLQGMMDMGITRDELMKQGLKFNGSTYAGSASGGDQNDAAIDAVTKAIASQYGDMMGAQANTLQGTWGTIWARVDDIYLRTMGFDEKSLNFRPDSVFAQLKKAGDWIAGLVTDISNLSQLQDDNVGLWDKIGAVWALINNKLRDWYDKGGGQQAITDVATKVGKTFGDVLASVFSPSADGKSNVFVDIGKSIATGVIKGFKDTFTLDKLTGAGGLGKSVSIVGATMLGGKVAGPGGAMLAGGVAGAATSFFDGKFDGYDVASGAMLAGAGLAAFKTKGKAFSGGMVGTGIDLFKGLKDKYLPSSDKKEEAAAAGPYDYTTKFDTIIGHLAKIEQCVCGPCKCGGGSIDLDGGGGDSGSSNKRRTTKVRRGRGTNLELPDPMPPGGQRRLPAPEPTRTTPNTRWVPTGQPGVDVELTPSQARRAAQTPHESTPVTTHAPARSTPSEVTRSTSSATTRATTRVASSSGAVDEAVEAVEKSAKWTSKLGGFAKRIPILGTLVNGLTLASSMGDGKAMASAAGNMAGAWAGGEAGAALGGAIGSIVPGPGTAIGAAVGGIGGAIAGGIGGEKAVGWIDDHMESIKSSLSDGWDGIKDFFGGIGDWFGGVWDSISSSFSDGVANVGSFFGSIPSFFGGIWDTVTSTFSAGFDGVVTFLGSIPQFFSDTWDSILTGVGTFGSNLWNGLTTWVSNTVTSVGEWIMDIPYYIGFGLGEAWRFITETLPQIWNEFSTWIGNLPMNIYDWMMGVWTNFTMWLGQTWMDVSMWVSTIWNEFSTWVGNLPMNIYDWMMGVWTNFTTWLSQTWMDVSLWVSNIWNSFSTWIGNLPGNVWNWMVSIWTGFTTWLSQLWTDAGTWLSGIAGSFGTWFLTAYNNAVQWIEGLPDAIAGFIAAIPGKVAGFLKSIGDTFLELGSKIMNSISDGINAALSKVGSIVHWVIDKAVDGYNFVVGSAEKGFSDGSTAGGGGGGGGGTLIATKQYHGGGLVEDEGWAILKRKEMVLDENLSSFIRTSAASSTGTFGGGGDGGGGGPVTVQIGALANTVHVREEADIQRIAAALSDELKRVVANQGAYRLGEVAR